MKEPAKNKRKAIIRKVLITKVVLLVLAGSVALYFLTKGFDDTASVEADYSVNAATFLNEFRANGALNDSANKKYTEKIITVNGRVTSVEAADTTLNLKMENAEGAYIAFAFQQKDQAVVKNIKAGDSVSVKGSCNGASFSSILGVAYVTFKRCTLNKLYKK